MTKFPVLDSILATGHLALFVRKKYNLGINTTCKVLRTGINHTYLISDNESKYVFRVYSYNWRSRTEILEELRFINLLRENVISVSYPFSDTSGNYIQEINAPEGVRYAVLFSFAHGSKVRNLTENICHDIGSLMSRLHDIAMTQQLARIKYNTETLAKLPYQYAKKHFPESLEEMKYVKNAGEYITATFQRADSSQLRHGVVHLDIWYDNMSIDEGSKITVFDFDFCGNGWLVLDISYFAMQLFHTEPDKDKFKLKLDGFFKGYEVNHMISDQERKLLPIAGLAVWIFYLGVQSRRFDNWSNIF